MGTALAMSAALFPTAMRENQTSFNGTIGAIICKNSLATARMLLRESDVPPGPPGTWRVIDENNATLISLADQHYPAGSLDNDPPYDPNTPGLPVVRGCILLGRRLSSAPQASFQLVAVSYAKLRPLAPGTRPVTAQPVMGNIRNDYAGYEDRSIFKATTAAYAGWLRIGSPLIFSDGTWAMIKGTANLDGDNGNEAILDRQLTTAPNDAFVIVEEGDGTFSPAMSVMSTFTGLRQ